MANIKGRCEPAYSVIVRLGGVTKVADICGVRPSTVSRWMIPEDEFGTGGSIPQKHWELLIQHCRRRHIAIDIYDLSGISRPK